MRRRLVSVVRIYWSECPVCGDIRAGWGRGSTFNPCYNTPECRGVSRVNHWKYVPIKKLVEFIKR